MKKIKLSQDKVTLVSNADFEYLSQWKWTYHNSTGYAYRNGYVIKNGNKKRTHILMHREIWKLHFGEIKDKMQIDHIDNNRLNNTIENLRIVTNQQNQFNRSKFKNKYKGISKRKKGSKLFWQAGITYNNKTYTKSFPYTEHGLELAIEWYNNKAKIFFGQYAYLNKKNKEVSMSSLFLCNFYLLKYVIFTLIITYHTSRLL